MGCCWRGHGHWCYGPASGWELSASFEEAPDGTRGTGPRSRVTAEELQEELAEIGEAIHRMTGPTG